MIGVARFLGRGHLGADLAQGFLLADPVALHQPAELELGPAGRDDDDVEEILEAGLDGQGGFRDIDGRAALARERGDDVFLLGQDEGVDDRVQGVPGGGVGEHERPQPAAVDRPVGGEDGGAEAGRHLAMGGAARRHELAGDVVGRMDETAQLGQDGGDDGFSGGDPPGQRDGEHGPQGFEGLPPPVPTGGRNM